MHSHLFTHAASTASPITRPRIIYMNGLGSVEDDYDEDDPDYPSSPPELVSSVKTPLLRRDPQPCKYDPCLENQEPCAQLSKETGCVCPGMSGADKLPHAPVIQALLPVSEGEDRGKIEVQWCAPSSVVSLYRVTVEGSDGETLEFGDNSRRGVVGSLEVGTKVCVEAVNPAGQSAPSEFSCKRYSAPQSSDFSPFVLLIGGGVLLLLLLVIVAVILWRYKKCQKAKRDSTDGLGNPSYSRGGTL